MMSHRTRAHRAHLTRRSICMLLVGLGLVIGLITISRVAAQSPVTYYVNASAGDDSRDGRSPATAWRTMDKVNTSTFDPGDRVLFKRGEVWTTALDVSGSGQPGNPITFGAYGSGPRPIIDGQSRLPKGIIIYHHSFVVIESLEVRNCTGSGVWTGGAVSDLTFRDLNVHHNDSNGIFLDHARNVLIDRCEIHDQSGLTDPSLLGAGIDVLGGTGTLEIRHCEIYNNATHGIYHETPGAYIHHNTIYNNGVGNASFAQHGVYSNADNTILEYNEVYDNLTTGISMRQSGGICQFNTCYDNGFAQIHYSQPDEQVDVSDTEFRFNVCWTTRDTSYGFSGTNMNDVRLFDNTFYCDTPGWTAAVEIPGDCRRVTLMNNIMCVTHRWAVSLFVDPGARNVVEDYNWLQRVDRSSDDEHIRWKGSVYALAAYRNISGQGAHSLEGDPEFQNPRAQDFSLRSDSRAIDAGTDVGLPFNGSAPDMGGIESNATANPPAGPDLAIEALSVSPIEVAPGEAVAVSLTVVNGGDAAADASSARIVLSADEIITTSDTALGSAQIGALPAGARQSITINVSIPTDDGPGSAFIGVVADAGNAVAELDELNNTAASSITIAQAPPPRMSFTVLSPNGGETWQLNTSATIQWTSVGLDSEDGVNIELSRDGGMTFERLFTNVANDGIHRWWVSGPTTSRAVLRISLSADSLISDTSDETYRISSSAPPTPVSITVLSPNGGERWVIGSVQTIRWTSTGVAGNVKILLSRNGKRRYKTIFRSLPNTGSVQWKVTGPESSRCRIRIVSLRNRTIRDKSDGLFTITP